MKFEYADIEQSPAKRYGACNQVGTYPLGAQLNWHGGMHINEDRNTAIKAITDGTIIAYRLNKEPIETNNGLKFSSGLYPPHQPHVSCHSNDCYFCLKKS